MNSTLITLPIFMLIIIGFATQLEGIANDTAGKAIEFSTDMSNAMDCATRAIPIEQCSPNLFDHDFTPEQEAFQMTLEEMQEALSNIEVVDENNATVQVIII
jgi:hypothetical protein